MAALLQTAGKSLIRELAKLTQRKYRRLSRRYIISGLRAVTGSLQSQNIEAQTLLLQEGREDLLEKLPPGAGELPCRLLPEKDFMRISAENAPQGIALLANRPVYDWRRQKPSSAVLLYLQQINDPGNLGTIIRSALWFGFKDILLSPRSTDPFGPKAVRSSAGYISHCRIYEDIAAAELKTLGHELGYQIVGTAAQEARDIRSFGPSEDKPVILLFGSEAHGLSPDLRELCGQMFTIPKSGWGESLNLATSVALFLYQAVSVNLLQTKT